MYLPKVSILMNCFNGDKYISEAIDSVLSQTYENWELIIWDNLSTDNSKNVISSYCDERIKYYCAKKHSDLGEARRLAYLRFSGDLIAFLDVDDIWFRNKLEKQVRVFEDKDIAICFTNTQYFSIKTTRDLYDQKFNPNLTTKKLITNYYLSLESIMIDNRKVKLLPYNFDPQFNHIADFDLIVRLSTCGKMIYLPEVLSGWRIHSDSESFIFNKKVFLEKDRWTSFHLKNNFLENYKESIKELRIINKSYIRILNYNFKNIFLDENIFIKYSSFYNFGKVLFSYLPIFPKIIFKFKRILYIKKWF